MNARLRLLPILISTSLAVAWLGCAEDVPPPEREGGPSTPAPRPPPPPPGGYGDAGEGAGCDRAAPSCREGLFCLPIRAPDAEDPFDGYRCVAGCTESAHCGLGRSCFASHRLDLPVPCDDDEACAALGNGASCGDDGACALLSFCGDRKEAGERCDATTLSFCSSRTADLVCVPADSADGRCRTVCDPASAGECAQGEVCANFFEDEGFGICGATSEDDSCDLVTTFCAPGKECTRPRDGGIGKCFARCDPTAEASTCGAGTSCAAPFPDPARGICAEVAATTASCDVDAFLFCAATDVCMDERSLGSGFVCRRSCTPGSTCAPGADATELRCATIAEDGRSICVPY